MKMKRIYTFTDEELQQLVNDGTSRVFIKKSVLHISLHAYHFVDLKQSLCEIFDESINHFKPELGGIVLSYRNIKVINDIGTIINDDSRIYIDVQADYYVFSPEVGCVLTGVVNKKSSDHVGCLVHKLFNVSIPRPEEGSWDGDSMEIGQKISFRVEFMDFDLNLPYIRGKLVDSSLHPELTEEPVKKKKKKKSKDKFKDEDGRLDNQPAEAQTNQDDKQEESAQPQNIKKKKKKDKKDKKQTVNLKQLLTINAQDNSESENLNEPLEDRLISKSSGEALSKSIDWSISRDFSDISVLACSTQNEEVSSKKKKKRKAKDMDNGNIDDNKIAVHNSEISEELMNSSYREELLDMKEKKKRKLFLNTSDLLIENNEDADQQLAAKKKSKKHKKHKQNNAESSEMPMQNNKPEDCEIAAKILTKASSGTQLSEKENVTLTKTKKQESSDVCGTNSNDVDISKEDEHTEVTTSKKRKKQAYNAILQSLTGNGGKNLNTAVDSSITDSGNPKKRKSSETKLDAVSSPNKKKSLRFSTEIEMIHVQDDVQADSGQNDVELNEEKISNGKETKSETDDSSSPISGASIASPFSSSIYSGANMVNSMDRKRKKVAKVNEDIAPLKRPINSISPSLISSTRALLQNFSEPNIKDPTVVGLSSQSSSEEIKEESSEGICSPKGKSGSEQGSLSLSPTKPLTQKESVSDTNVSEGFNSTINALEPLDISHLIARLNCSANTVDQKQEQAPKAGKEKKSKRKKQVEIVSKGDSQPAKLNTIDTGEKSNENTSAGINSKINATELPNVSELIARLNSDNAGVQKQEQSPKSPKADKDKKNKTKKKEVKIASPKSKHKEHKKDKKNKHEKKEDKSKKEKDKKKKESKASKEKKKTKQENDLTDLSRKLLHDFLKKQNTN